MDVKRRGQKQPSNNQLLISHWSKPCRQKATCLTSSFGWRGEIEIELIFVVSDLENDFICLISYLRGPLYRQPKKKCVIHPHRLSFAGCSSTASSDWPFLKDYEDILICFMFQSAAADGGQVGSVQPPKKFKSFSRSFTTINTFCQLCPPGGSKLQA